jgi:hypothetical protein
MAETIAPNCSYGHRLDYAKRGDLQGLRQLSNCDTRTRRLGLFRSHRTLDEGGEREGGWHGRSTISRRRFIRTIGVGATAVGVSVAGFGGRAGASSGSPNPDPGNILVGDGSAAVSGAHEIIVTGRADSLQDAANIQWALDNVTEGGTVRLSGEFHFSDFDPNGELVYSCIHVHQPYQPWYGPHYLGLPMYYIPGTVQRYVKFAVPAPDPNDPTTTIQHYVDPYLGIPLFPATTPMPEVPVMVYGANDRQVFIARSVNIIGDSQATIRGGAWPLTVGSHPFQVNYDFFFDSIQRFPWDTVRWDAEMGGIDPFKMLDVTIEGIEFIDPWEAAILCEAATSLTVKGNHFRDMRGFDLANWSLFPGQSFAGPHHPPAYCMMIAAAGGSTMPGTAKDLISGQVVITDNYCDARSREVEVAPKQSTCPPGCFEQQVVTDHVTLESETFCVPFGANAQSRAWLVPPHPNVFGWRGATAGARLALLNADVLMARNELVNGSSLGLTCESNYGTTLITKNVIEFSNDPMGADIFSHRIWVSDSHWTGERGTSGSTVAGNTIEGRNEYGDGALTLVDVEDAVVTKNEIDMTEGRIPLWVGGCGDSLFGRNKLSGRADNGVLVVGHDVTAAPSAGNEFIGNNLASTDLDVSTYFFGPYTHSNTVRGDSGGTDSVVDLNPSGPYAAMPNYIAGVTPMDGAGGAGDTAKEAAKQMNDALTRWRDTLNMLRKEFGSLRPH